MHKMHNVPSTHNEHIHHIVVSIQHIGIATGTSERMENCSPYIGNRRTMIKAMSLSHVHSFSLALLVVSNAVYVLPSSRTSAVIYGSVTQPFTFTCTRACMKSDREGGEKR